MFSKTTHTIINGDSRQMSELKDKSVHLIVTWKECYRVLHDGCRLCINIGDQFADVISTVETKNVKAEKIAILDGFLYIKGNNKMYKSVTETYKNYNIMSALVLRNYLYQL